MIEKLHKEDSADNFRFLFVAFKEGGHLCGFFGLEDLECVTSSWNVVCFLEIEAFLSL